MRNTNFPNVHHRKNGTTIKQITKLRSQGSKTNNHNVNNIILHESKCANSKSSVKVLHETQNHLKSKMSKLFTVLQDNTIIGHIFINL